MQIHTSRERCYSWPYNRHRPTKDMIGSLSCHNESKTLSHGLVLSCSYWTHLIEHLGTARLQQACQRCNTRGEFRLAQLLLSWKSSGMFLKAGASQSDKQKYLTLKRQKDTQRDPSALSHHCCTCKEHRIRTHSHKMPQLLQGADSETMTNAETAHFSSLFTVTTQLIKPRCNTWCSEKLSNRSISNHINLNHLVTTLRVTQNPKHKFLLLMFTT